MGLLGPTAQVIRGAVRFRGTDLLGLAPKERRAYAGEHIAMVFQDALAALNPVHSVGYQITEALRHAPRHEPQRRPPAGDRAARDGQGAAGRHRASATTRTSSPAGCASGS